MLLSRAKPSTTENILPPSKGTAHNECILLAGHNAVREDSSQVWKTKFRLSVIFL